MGSMSKCRTYLCLIYAIYTILNKPRLLMEHRASLKHVTGGMMSK